MSGVKDEDDFAHVGTAISAFAAEGGMVVVPAVPEPGYGPEVDLGPVTDLPGFLALASKLASDVLYLRATPFNPADYAYSEDPPAHLTSHEGKTGQVSAAFVSNGLVHFWERTTAWYEEWVDLIENAASQRDLDLDVSGRPSREERARLAREYADALLGDRQFRSTRQANTRQRLARMLLPADTDNVVLWDALREAIDKADELAQQHYSQIPDRLDDMAAELLSSREYQHASSPAARRQAAEQFLIARADGFFRASTAAGEAARDGQRAVLRRWAGTRSRRRHHGEADCASD